MGFVGDMLSGSKGAGFQAVAPSSAQVNGAYDQTQATIDQQRAFVNQLAGQMGLTHQNQVFGQQQALANQLQGVANGTGPNPALAQLNQATGANTANQAALMAGQRGAAANTGLIARQAAMQGAANQQNAAGQAATLQAQQQLAGMQQLQNQQSSMGNLANTQVNQQQQGLTALNNAALQQQSNLYGLQGNANSANAGIAGANTAGQQNLLGGIMGGIGSIGHLFGGGGGAASGVATTAGPTMAGGAGDAVGGAGDLLAAAKGGMVPKMADGGDVAADPLMSTIPNKEVADLSAPALKTGPQSNVVKTMNTDTSMHAPVKPSGGGNPLAGIIPAVAGVVGGAGKMVGSGLGSMGKMVGIGGGPDKGTFGGGISNNLGHGDIANAFGNIANMYTSGSRLTGFAGNDLAKNTGIQDTSSVFDRFASGGKVPALVSPGERYLNPEQVEQVAKGEASPMKAGKEVPGKPKVGGAKNDYANDTVPAKLDVGGVVLPRSVTQSSKPDAKAEAFIKAVLARKGSKLPAKC